MSTPITNVRIAQSLLAEFPNLTVGGFAVRGLDAPAVTLNDQTISALWDAARTALDEAGVGIDGLAQTSGIAEWRAAVAACGLKPSMFRSSVEALTRRVLKDGKISTPLRIVDAYCAISVQHLVPIGSYDVDRLPSRTLELRHIDPEHDRFEPIGGALGQFPMLSSVPAYTSATTVLCWGFNHRDSRETCVQPTTRTAVFFGEALTSNAKLRLETAMNALAALCFVHGARPGPIAFSDREVPEITLTA